MHILAYGKGEKVSIHVLTPSVHILASYFYTCIDSFYTYIGFLWEKGKRFLYMY